MPENARTSILYLPLDTTREPLFDDDSREAMPRSCPLYKFPQRSFEGKRANRVRFDYLETNPAFPSTRSLSQLS